MPKIAYAQIKAAAGHPDLNTKKILRLIDEARTQGADMIIFPEFSIAGQMLSDADWEQMSFFSECTDYIEEIIEASKDIFVIFGAELGSQMETTYNIFKDGDFADEEDLPVKTEILGDNDEQFSCNSDLCIRFVSEPYSVEGVYSFDENIKRPLICVGKIGVQNSGKVVYTFDGGSKVFNSRGEVVQLIEPYTEGLNFIEFDDIDKMPALEVPEVGETAEIYRAIHYGAKEFLNQIGMSKVVIGVSGGIDSAVAAALYTQVVGAENVFLVNMPSVFNSSTTKNLSERLAKNLGCKYYVVPIQESVDWTVKQLEERGISVSSFVRENIQARDRSSRILAAIAASVGGVFTCNANKAETTVGYATLYGDEAGFLSALADLWKYQVYDLARYMNSEIYKREVIPQGIIDIVPSAELSNAQNVDEGKGDPLKYPYHDYLFSAFIEENHTPEEILRWYVTDELEYNLGCERGLVEKYFPNAQDFIADLERWWKAFKGMGVAKRLQAPPILAVTNTPYGRYSESQNGVHFSRAYLELKEKLLSE